jgi:hypothetical protein
MVTVTIQLRAADCREALANLRAAFGRREEARNSVLPRRGPDGRGNAWFIKDARGGLQKTCPSRKILRATMDTADAIAVSCKKDPLVNIAALIVLPDAGDVPHAAAALIVFRGIRHYAAFAGRDLEGARAGASRE